MLADRAERVNEWIDRDMIVLARLNSDLKAGSQFTTSNAPEIRLTQAGSSSSSPVEMPSLPDRINELNTRIARTNRFRKDLEGSVYWQRAEYRRIEKALGRTKSGQSGAVGPPTRNVGFSDQGESAKKGRLSIAGGLEDNVDTDKNRNALADLEAKLQAGMSLEEATEDQKPMREQDFARDRWTSSSSRLPHQAEWEDLFGPKVGG